MLTVASFLAAAAIALHADNDGAVFTMVPDDESLIPEVQEGQNDASSKTNDYFSNAESSAVSFPFGIPEAEVCAKCFILSSLFNIFYIADRNLSWTSYANKLYGACALRYMASYTECFEQSLLTR